MEADIAAMLDESDEENDDIDGLVGHNDRGWTVDKEEPGDHNDTIDRLLGNIGDLDNLENVINTDVLDEFVTDEENEREDKRDDHSSDSDSDSENESNEKDDSGGDYSDSELNSTLNTTRTESTQSHGRKKKKKLVHSLDSCLDLANYDPYVFPEKRKEYTFVMETGTKNKPAKFQECRRRSRTTCSGKHNEHRARSS